MRFLLLVRANERTETGMMPTKQELTEMGVFNDELVKAGALLAG